MAFQEVGGSNFKKLTALGVGESLTGYLLATKDGRLENSKTLVMRIDGASVDVAAAGNVRYMINDNKLAVGQMTRITRAEDKLVKGGKKSSNFTVEQDPSDTIDTGNQAASTPKAETQQGPSMAEKIAALKSGK